MATEDRAQKYHLCACVDDYMVIYYHADVKFYLYSTLLVFQMMSYDQITNLQIGNDTYLIDY